jgi:hypothetical protein
LEPPLVARIDGVFYVVDGHHRLRAYRLARRVSVPVRIKETTWMHASLLSKLVNADGTKLPMHPEECREAAWQFLAQVTGRGRFTLREIGMSLREVAAMFNVSSQQTIANMMDKMVSTKHALDAASFDSSWCDAITGWPRWKDARSPGGLPFDDVPIDVREAHRRARCRAAIAKLQEQYGRDVYDLAHAELTCEDAQQQEAEAAEDY